MKPEEPVALHGAAGSISFSASPYKEQSQEPFCRLFLSQNYHLRKDVNLPPSFRQF
jgi:hypothetical protein